MNCGIYKGFLIYVNVPLFSPLHGIYFIFVEKVKEVKMNFLRPLSAKSKIVMSLFSATLLIALAST